MLARCQLRGLRHVADRPGLYATTLHGVGGVYPGWTAPHACDVGFLTDRRLSSFWEHARPLLLRPRRGLCVRRQAGVGCDASLCSVAVALCCTRPAPLEGVRSLEIGIVYLVSSWPSHGLMVEEANQCLDPSSPVHMARSIYLVHRARSHASGLVSVAKQC
jgi:hypothetical protein